MNIRDIIIKKRDGYALSKEEISYFVTKVANKEIEEYQISAFCMATYFMGMNAEEMNNLTVEITSSGDVLDLSSIDGIKVDKHSTGGVGDSVSLVLGPMLASCGLVVSKMSGRSLGHSGGTIDKLESIPGFRVDLDNDELCAQLKEIKIAIISQTKQMAPVDKVMYAIRDTSGSVESIPLIASSIMSKKLAVGADFLLLDVKVGDGAFMESLSEAKELAVAMVDIAKLSKIPCIAVVTDMNQPLSSAIGNAIEVKCAIETLKGAGSERLRELCIDLAAMTFLKCGLDVDIVSATLRAKNSLESMAAFNTFKEMVRMQGGDVQYVDNPDMIELAQHQITLKAAEQGYVSNISARVIAEAVVSLGAGRKSKQDAIDLTVGVELFKTVGDSVSIGDPLAKIYAKDQESLSNALEMISEAIAISAEEVAKESMILDVISN